MNRAKLWTLLVHAMVISSLIRSTSSFVHQPSSFSRPKYLAVNLPSSPLRVKPKESKTFSVIKEGKGEAIEPTLWGFPRDTVAAPLALLLVSQFLLFIGVGAVIPSIPLYGKAIGLSSAANGVVISAPAVALLLGGESGGKYADRHRKPAMLWGMLVIAVSDVGTAMAYSLPTLIVARLGLGAGRCISEAGERGMLADLANRVPGLRGRALAAQQVVVALGIAVGAPLGGIIVEEYGPRASFLCVSAAALATLFLYSFLPETRTDVEVSDGEKDTSSAVVSEGEWARLLTTNQWRGLALCQCGATFGFAAKIASIPILATTFLPGGAAGAGALISAAGLSGIAGAPIGGWLTDQMSAKTTALLSGLVSATGLILVPFALDASFSGDTSYSFLGLTLDGQAAVFSAAVLIWSFGASAQGPALTALAQELAPPGAEATAMALPRATGDGTYIVAPFVLGLITDSGLPTGAECAFAGAATLVGIMALLLLRDKQASTV